jgi:4-amino-4-deoxy-L-arabinose transferase-like glycosyltransferase
MTDDQKDTAGLSLLLAASFLSRWPGRAAALIRDEGEYAYIGQRILHGALPYRDIYNQKTPFVFYLMAAYQRFLGPALPALRLSTTIYGLAATILVFLLARKLLGRAPAFIAAAAFTVMTFDQAGAIDSSCTEFYMLLWIAAALLLWQHALKSLGAGWLLLAGAAAGMAYQTKQTGLVLIIYFVAERFWNRRLAPSNLKPAALVSPLVGFLLVQCLVMSYFAAHGGLRDYIECTWSHNWQYVGRRHLGWTQTGELAVSALTAVARWDAGLWVWGAAGLAGAALSKRPGLLGGLWILLCLLGAAAFTAGIPYAHYYLPLIVPLSLGTAMSSSWLWERIRLEKDSARRAGLAIVLIIPWTGPLMRLLRPPRPPSVLALFDQAPTAAQYLARRTAPGEPVLIIGSEPEIYFYADRPAASRMVITYPMTGPYSYAPSLAEEFLRDLTIRRPRYVVLMNNIPSVTEWPAYGESFMRPVLQFLSRNYVRDAQAPPLAEIVILRLKA